MAPVNPIRVLQLEEVRAVIKDIRRRSYRTRASMMNLVIFRLSACCGLRRKEIHGLQWRDIVLNGSRPCIRVRAEITKGREGKRKARIVPLWWDSGTLNDLKRWKKWREKLELAVAPTSPVVCLLKRAASGRAVGSTLLMNDIQRRWKTAIRVLGPERVQQLSIHTGRHTFISHAVLVRPLAAVRDAAGHSNIATTSTYLHVIDDSTREYRDIF